MRARLTPQPGIHLEALRRYAIRRTLFTPTTLPRALARLGFVQMDPIRAPARAQDLVLRHRVKGYCAGDLEARYARLDVQEDFFVNYGVLTSQAQALMHPRVAAKVWSAERSAQAEAILAFVVAQRVVHPREVNQAFEHGQARNWFGGRSHASTQLLDEMHYRGLLRIARRESGIRCYALPTAVWRDDPVDQRLDALIDLMVNLYAPLPASSLVQLVAHLRNGVPQWREHLTAGKQRVVQRLSSAMVDGQRWFWPADESPAVWRERADDRVYLLAPFDPLVWDRKRFELFWHWAYRFEAYLPAKQRERGYYALPMLWREQVIGWANLSVVGGRLSAELGFVANRPSERAFADALDAELQRVASFLRVADHVAEPR